MDLPLGDLDENVEGKKLSLVPAIIRSDDNDLIIRLMWRPG